MKVFSQSIVLIIESERKKDFVLFRSIILEVRVTHQQRAEKQFQPCTYTRRMEFDTGELFSCKTLLIEPFNQYEY